jgi:hypothetical protein
MWRSLAAREKLPVLASARKSSNQVRFMGGALRAWNKKKPALDAGAGGADDSPITHQQRSLP